MPVLLGPIGARYCLEVMAELVKTPFSQVFDWLNSVSPVPHPAVCGSRIVVSLCGAFAS